MKETKVNRLYHYLTPGERLSLLTQAIARADDADFFRLESSAQEDPEFISLRRAMAWCLLFYHMERLELMLKYCACQCYYHRCPPGDLELFEAYSSADRVVRIQLERRKAGWKLFCEEMGVPAECLLEYMPGRELIERLENELLPRTPVDDDLLQELEERDKGNAEVLESVADIVQGWRDTLAQMRERYRTGGMRLSR